MARLPAHPCPFERPVEGRKVRTDKPLALLRRPLIDAEGEAGIAVPELLGDVDRIVSPRKGRVTQVGLDDDRL